MPDSPRRAILFDLDGTLVDTITLLLESVRHAFQGRTGRVPTDEEWISGIGTPLASQLRPYATDKRTSRHWSNPTAATSAQTSIASPTPTPASSTLRTLSSAATPWPSSHRSPTGWRSARSTTWASPRISLRSSGRNHDAPQAGPGARPLRARTGTRPCYRRGVRRRLPLRHPLRQRRWRHLGRRSLGLLLRAVLEAAHPAHLLEHISSLPHLLDAIPD